MSSIDFDDDFDDILQSDDEFSKKPKTSLLKNIKTENLIDNNNVIDKELIISNNLSSMLEKPKKSVHDNLFDDDTDYLTKLESSSSKENKTKPAKSVLDSMLNPSKELSDMNFSFGKAIQKSNNNNVDNKIESIFSDNKSRPSTGKPKTTNESIANSINKRTVRFSTETLVDGELDLDSSLNTTRPQTAPNTSNVLDSGKKKFYNRFEAAEYDEIPIKSNESIKLTSGSDSSLWPESKSDEFTNIIGNVTKAKHEINEETKIKAPKQKLTEFMQSSQEDFLSQSPDKRRLSGFEEISPTRLSNNFRRNSQEDLLDRRPRTSTNMNDECDFGRRASISNGLPLERPKTSYNKYDKLEISSDTPFFSNVSMNDMTDYQLKIKHLESEKDELLYKLNKIKERNNEELTMNENRYKNRIEIMEEDIRLKEKRLKEEIDLLSEQNKQKLQILEQERLEMRSELTRRQDEFDYQKKQEISRICEQHKCEMDKLRNNHEILIEKLHHAKTEEDTTIRMAQPTTLQLQSVLTQVSNGAQDLVSIKQQLMDQVNKQIKEKDIELKDKNEYLRQLEEKLDIQKDENMKERERLQSLISKLDIQLKEQMRTAEEERWFLRQEQNKLSALQSSLEKEREQILIEKDQNRLSHEEFRKRLLDEQKQMFEQIYEEKRIMTEERAKLTREMFKWSESNQLTNVKKNQETAEIEGIRSALLSERRELEKIRSQINSDREELLLKTSKIESLDYETRMKMEKLANYEKDFNTKQTLINEKEQHFREIETRGEESLRKAKELHTNNDNQISNIQRQLLTLKDKEQYINKQLIELEQRRTELINKEKTIVCSKCSNSLNNNNNNGIGGSYNNLNKLSINGLKNSMDHSPPYNPRFNSSFDNQIKNSLDYSSMVASQMEEERLIHSIHLEAQNDREFLSQERVYLDSLIGGFQPSWKSHVRS